MQFNTKSTKENANTKATKSIFFGVPCLPAGRFVLNFVCFVLTCISFL
jgi:hypothetical protein